MILSTKGGHHYANNNRDAGTPQGSAYGAQPRSERQYYSKN